MKKELALLSIAAILVLSVIALARPPGILAGEEAYYHLLTASQKGSSSLTAVERPVIISQYDYLLRIAFRFFEPVIFMKIFPVVLGAVCVILFYLVSRKFLKEKGALYAGIIFILSPTFLYIFSTNSAEIVSLFLVLLGIVLLIDKNRYLSYISIVPFVLSSLSSMFAAILVILIYATYFISKKEKRYDLAIGSILIVLVIIFLRPKFIVDYSLSNLPMTANLFSDFGGLLGISIFTAIFTVAGLIAARKREYSYPIIIYIIVSFLVNYRTIIYGNVLVCAFAGLGLNSIIKKKWALNNLKQVMNFLMIGGILFSAVSHITLVKNSPPSAELISAAKWLGLNSDKGSVVLSAVPNSFIIEYFGNRTVMLDPLSYYSKNFDILTNDSGEIYYSRSLDKTGKLLNKYNISYILVDPGMLGGEIWRKPSEGLLFLFTNQEIFPTVYNKGGVKIIYYTG